MQKVYFLSGTMCTEDLWQFIFPNLKTVIPVHIDITLADSFEGINQLILNIIPKEEPVTLIGFSLGGFSAMNFALTYPEKVKRLVVIAANANGLNDHEIRLRTSTIEFLEKHSYKGISQARIQQFLHPANHKNDTLIHIIKKMDADLGKEVLIKQLKATSNRIDISNTLSSFEKPILFITAENDSLVNALEVKELSKTIRKATFVCFKDSGHMIPIEKPTELTYLLASYFS